MFLHLDHHTCNILFHPFPLPFSSIPAQNSYHAPQTSILLLCETKHITSHITIRSHIHTSPHTPRFNIPQPSNESEALQIESSKLKPGLPPLVLARNPNYVQSPKGAAKGQFDERYEGVKPFSFIRSILAWNAIKVQILSCAVKRLKHYEAFLLC